MVTITKVLGFPLYLLWILIPFVLSPIVSTYNLLGGSKDITGTSMLVAISLAFVLGIWLLSNKNILAAYWFFSPIVHLCWFGLKCAWLHWSETHDKFVGIKDKELE